jgi:hypothetical protein
MGERTEEENEIIQVLEKMVISGQTIVNGEVCGA